jgi:transcriptional regulator with XRE-family HTH domain
MDEQQAKTFGTMLRQRRHALGLTVRQVGETTGIASTTVSRIETGSFEAPRPDKLARIAQALELSTGEVFAQAGYLDATDLPEYETYLRTKRPDLPESAIQSLHDHFAQILSQFNLVPVPQPALEESTDESQGVTR